MHARLCIYICVCALLCVYARIDLHISLEPGALVTVHLVIRAEMKRAPDAAAERKAAAASGCCLIM